MEELIRELTDQILDLRRQVDELRDRMEFREIKDRTSEDPEADPEIPDEPDALEVDEQEIKAPPEPPPSKSTGAPGIEDMQIPSWKTRPLAAPESPRVAKTDLPEADAPSSSPLDPGHPEAQRGGESPLLPDIQVPYHKFAEPSTDGLVLPPVGAVGAVEDVSGVPVDVSEPEPPPEPPPVSADGYRVDGLQTDPLRDPDRVVQPPGPVIPSPPMRGVAAGATSGQTSYLSRGDHEDLQNQESDMRDATTMFVDSFTRILNVLATALIDATDRINRMDADLHRLLVDRDDIL